MKDKTLDLSIILNKKTIISFIISFAILYFLMKNVDIKNVISVSKNLNLTLYFWAIAAYYSSFFIRGLRWQKLLDTIKIRVSIFPLTEMVFLSWFANSIVPAKIGDIYRSSLLKKYNNVSISTSIGTIVAERIFDLSVLIILLSVSGLLLFKGKMPLEIKQSIEIGSILLGFIILMLVLLKLFKNYIRKIIPKKFVNIFENLHHGVYNSFSNMDTFVYVAILTIVTWILEAGRFLLVSRALGVNLDLLAIIFVVLAASLITALPLTPAGLGAVEVAIVGILAILGVDTAIGTSLALLDRIISYWSILAVGAIVYTISDKT